MKLFTRVARRFGFVPKNELRRAFAAARISRLTSSWETIERNINDELRGDLDRLRARSRDLFKNDEYAKKFGRMVRTNVVGKNGIFIKQRIYDANWKPDTAAQTAVADAWKRWCKRGICEIAGRQSFKDLQRGLITDAARDGEFLLIKIRGQEAGNEFGFALQRLDPSRIDTKYNIAAGNGVNAVIMGVEVDRRSRAVAYHIIDADGSVDGIGKRIRVPADEVVHGFISDDFAEAKRGVPWMHAAMLRLNDLKAYREAAIIAARIGASKMGFYIQKEDQITDPDEISDGRDEDGRLLDKVEPGVFDLLPQSVADFKTFDPAYPHDQFDPFTASALRGISSGLGVSYVELANDLEGVNYSSIRQGVLAERDEWMTIQEWFIDAFIEEVYPEWLRFALLNGQIISERGVIYPLSMYEKLLPHECIGRRWQWVDPLKDAKAATHLLDYKLTSRTRIANGSGEDIEDVFGELENEDDLGKEYGIDLTSPASVATSKEEKDETEAN
ncbi:MAG: phage portal protein [Burkholderiales bacterium]|jgi:lambda family phage portal protein|nr:phage portal protein [Burkholderiales bacterium]